MVLVRVITDFPSAGFLDQTPEGAGVWQGVRFTLDPVERCDFAVVCNRVLEETPLVVPPDNLWQVTMEPPIEYFRYLRRSFRQFRYVFTQDPSLRGDRYVHCHGALPWHVGLNYDELIRRKRPEKIADLSWITSNKAQFLGHKTRMTLLAALRGRMDFELWGEGFRPLDKKWDGLSSFRYSLAIENYHGADYWTEKIADCYLSWTMPIYWGATNITSYFPAESMALVDAGDPDTAIEQIEETVRSDRFERNIDAIAHARDLVLNKYQFFPFIADRIRRHEPVSADNSPRPLVIRPAHRPALVSLCSSLCSAVRSKIALRTRLARLRSRVFAEPDGRGETG